MKIEETKKPFNLMIVINTLVLLIPLVIYVSIMIIVLNIYPIVEGITCYEVENLNDMDSLHEEGYSNIEFETNELVYTGYNYYLDGDLAGAYYYGFVDNRCLFVLVKTKNIETKLSRYVVKGKLMEENPSYEHMKTQFAKDLDMDYEALNDFTYAYFVSEIDYPYVHNLLIYLFVFAPMFFAFICIIACLIYIRHPYLHPVCNKLLAFGENKEDIVLELNSQIKFRKVFSNKRCIITDEYLIMYGLVSTNVIRIDYIEYISKHVDRFSPKLLKNHPKYRLTMSNPDKMYYEKVFYNSKDVDDIMEILIKLCPNLDDSFIDEWR